MSATYGSLLRSRSRIIGCSVAVVCAISATFVASAGATEASPAWATAPVTTYVALGDSISFGYTQEKFNVNFPNESPSYFEEGFTNFFNDKLRAKYPKNTLVNNACPGETSNGLIGENPALGGKKSTENNKRLGDYHPCSYHNQLGFPLHNSLKELSQLEETLSILKEGKPAHPVTAITLNIGSNDELAAISQCEEEVKNEFTKTGKSKYGSTPEEAVKNCIVQTALTVTFPHIANNIAKILGAIDSQAKGGGHYTGRIVVLGYYNPDSFVIPGSDGLQVALNEAIEKEVIPHFPNARYANPFPIFNKGYGKSEAEEQASICKYTEMCNPNVQVPGGKPAGKDGDIHPSLAGYRALACLVYAAYIKP